MSAGIVQRSNSSQKRCEEQSQFGEAAYCRGSNDVLVLRQLAACKTLASTKIGAQSSYQVPGAAPRLATLLQDGHHVLSARGGPHLKKGSLQLREEGLPRKKRGVLLLREEEGVSRLARDLQKRASIGAARALERVRSRRTVCRFSRRRMDRIRE